MNTCHGKIHDHQGAVTPHACSYPAGHESEGFPHAAIRAGATCAGEPPIVIVAVDEKPVTA